MSQIHCHGGKGRVCVGLCVSESSSDGKVRKVGVQRTGYCVGQSRTRGREVLDGRRYWLDERRGTCGWASDEKALVTREWRREKEKARASRGEHSP